MMIRLKFITPVLLGAVLFSCNTQKEVATPPPITPATEQTDTAHEVIFPYRESRERLFNLVHTSLSVNFDIAKQHLLGTAELTLHPYFYPQKQLVLDAQGFDLNTVGIRYNGHTTAMRYDYNQKQITIFLDKEYTRNDTVTVWIDYVAKPEELKTEGGTAITDAKGIYFIDPLDEDPEKPTQIWTQGETEASSAWFPTIDSPNENMTQDITITVEDRFVTLSNGTLVSTKNNGDGTHTDRWEQKDPHAPYLAMMAVGEFAVVKDTWKDMDVDYYVEKEYEEYADDIFGNTPEMLEYFSGILGYQYPWEKYSQIVVRDYVSGAMENTSAVIHGEFLQQTDREMLDHNFEDVISHELFHHWFGDLVTCESWSNLPLNESFATYGENLWREHKYGRFSADNHGATQLRTYLMEAKKKQVNMVRFHYDKPDDMFDSHSYAKGGRILHMLRKHLGDDAFFQSLNLYLTEHKYTSVEMHDLRLACEKVSGQDLNWFFNQWFYASGHPQLEITHNFNAEKKEYSVTIKQNQNLNTTPLYRLPMAVDIYVNSKVKRKMIVLNQQEQTFTFKLKNKPDLVNVDAEKMLLCTKTEELPQDQRIFQLNSAPLYLDKIEALNTLNGSADSLAQVAIGKLLNHEYDKLRSKAISTLKKCYPLVNKTQLVAKVHNLMLKDPKPSVRTSAMSFLKKVSPETITEADLTALLNDRSFRVSSKALEMIGEQNPKKALELAKNLEKEATGSQLMGIATLYSTQGTAEQMQFMENALDKVSDFNDKYVIVQLFGKFVLRQNETTQYKSLEKLGALALNAKVWFVRMSAIQVLAEMGFANRENPDISNKLAAIMNEVKETETDPNVLKLLGE